MGEDRLGDARFLAPTELRTDSSVTEKPLAASAHQRPRHRGAVADKQFNSPQRVRPIVDIDYVWHVKDGGRTGGDALTYCRCSQ